MKKVAVNILIILVLLSFVTHADIFDVGADAIAKTNSNLFVRGCARYGGNFSCMPGVTINATLSNTTGVVSSATAVSAAENFFEINLTSPPIAGNYEIRVFASAGNTSVIPPVLIPTSVRNISSANVTLLANKPPFSNGSSFLINVTFDGTLPSEPSMKAFNPNGNMSAGWGFTLVSSTPFSRAYNVTVPANADGKYIVIAEEGAGFLFFVVKSSLVVVGDIQSTDNATKSIFAPSGTVRLVAKVRDDSGPKTSATVTAYVTKPDASVLTAALTHSSTTNGTYTTTFTDTSLSGPYSVKIVANISGKFVETTAFFNVRNLETKLDIVKDFFFEFGGSSSFGAGGQVGFNILVFDKASNDNLIQGALNGSLGFVNCGNTTPILFKNAVTGATPSIGIVTNSLNNYFGQNVCKINFTAPQASGIYQLTVNITIGNATSNSTTLATGYFSVQNYVLKVSPVSTIGSGNEYLNALVPGENATFEIAVRNLSNNGSAIDASLITAISVTKISPIDFVGGGAADITNLTYNVSYGSGTANPRITIMMPENATGPFTIEVQSTIAGSVVKGTAFYFAKYIEGFASPSGFFQGPPEGGSSGGSFKCSGTQTFSIKTFDIKTKQPAKGVTFNSISEAREEVTGRSIKSLLTFVSSSSSDSDGNGNITVSFSSATTFSGFNFFLVNATTSGGKQDVIPGGFECKTLHFFPEVRGADSNDFNVGPNSSINISVTRIKNVANGTPYTVKSGNMKVFALENFDPSKGESFYQGPSTSYPLDDGNATVILSPANFSLVKWPSGFNGMMLQVCDNKTTSDTSDDTCDYSFGGFRSVSFDAFIDFSTIPPTQIAPFDNITLRIRAKTNVTNDGNTTIANFRPSVGQPWNGFVATPVANGTKLEDGWNKSADFGFELWNVTFQIPDTVRKGGNVVTIKIKDYRNETADLEFYFNVVKNTVFVPDGEGVFMTNFSLKSNISDSGHVNTMNETFRINISVLNANYNIRSKSNFTCGVLGFNVTRFGPNQQMVSYGLNTTILAVDNSTPNLANVLVVRSHTNNIAIAHAGNRSLAGAGFPTLYLRSVDCGFAEIINTNTTYNGFGAGFGGQHRKAVEFAIPIIVKRGSTPRAGVTVDVAQIVLQQDFGGGRGGFGFDGFLPASNYTRFPAVTDANGVAFLRLNITVSGSYGIIWNISGADGTDAAEFNQVIPVEIKTFNSHGTFVSNPHAIRTINLTPSIENGVRNVTRFGDRYFFAVWDETNGEIMTNGVQNITIALRNMTQNQPSKSPGPLQDMYASNTIGAFTEILFDDDTHACTNCSGAEDGGTNFPIFNNWTETFRTSGDSKNPLGFMGVDFAIDGNISYPTGFETNPASITSIRILLAPATQGGMGFKTVSSTSEAVAVRVCAKSFDRPEKPIIKANITLVAESFTGFGPPIITNLTITDPFSGGATESIITGPSGCASFNISMPGGWARNNNVRGTITYGSNRENVWVGNINVM